MLDRSRISGGAAVNHNLVSELAGMQGVVLPPDRSQAIASGLAQFRPRLEASARRLAFEVEPASFIVALEKGRGE
jgi:hypothetical protein